jgi:Uma2 family endonuclease
MAVPTSTPSVDDQEYYARPLSPDDQEYYPLHVEDDVPEIPPHRRAVTYLENAFTARFPGWFITGNVCIYWERGDTQQYRAPDLFMVREPLAEPVERVYQTWKQPRVTFVAEVGSRSTFREDEGPKVEIYRDQIRVEEYLYADPPRGVLRLWRWSAGEFSLASPDTNGRLRSAALALEFGLDEAGELRAYTLEGEPLLTHQETDQARQAAEAARQTEAAARQTAEARAAELERQLAALQERLSEG